MSPKDDTMTKKFKVQKCVALAGKLPSGVRVGRVWETVGTYGRRAVAERVAQNLRQDLHDNEVRVSQ
jgi:hypothetical protein